MTQETGNWRRALLAVLAALLAVGFSPMWYGPFHDRYVFALGRVAAGVRVGQGCADARRAMTAYQAERATLRDFEGEPRVRFADDPSDDAVASGEPRYYAHNYPGGRVMQLVDQSAFDHDELIVACDAAGRVAAKSYRPVRHV